MKITYHNETGLLYLENVPFTIERLKMIVEFFKYEHSQFYSTITMMDNITNEVVEIYPHNVIDILFAMSKHQIASDRDFN